MAPMTLNELLKEIKNLRVFANEDVDSGPPETMNGRRGRKTQAVEALKRLRSAYSIELRNSAAFILVVGNKREEFSKLATEEFKCFAADTGLFYTDLVEKIPQSYYLGRESVSNLFDILGRHLEDKMSNLDVLGYPQLLFKQEYQQTIRSKEEFVGLIRRAITEQIGGEIVGIQAIAQLTDTAIDKNHSAKLTPVILPAESEVFALTVARDLARISNKIFVVGAGEVTNELKKSKKAILVEEPTSDSVKKTLTNIKNLLKK